MTSRSRGQPRVRSRSRPTVLESCTSRTGSCISGRWGTSKRRPIPGTNLDAASPFFSPDGQWVGFFSVSDSLTQEDRDRRRDAADPVQGRRALGCELGRRSHRLRQSNPRHHARFRQRRRAGSHRQDRRGNCGRGGLWSATAGRRTAAALHARIRARDRSVGPGTGRRPVDGLRRAPRSGHVVGARLGTCRRGVARRRVPIATTAISCMRSAIHCWRCRSISRVSTKPAASPVPIVEQVARSANLTTGSGVAQYDVSATGTLAYLPGASRGSAGTRTLALADRDGKTHPLNVGAQPYFHPRLSPDGRQLVVGTDDGRDAVVWVLRPQGWWLAAPAHIRWAQSIPNLDARRPLHHLSIGSGRRRRHLQTAGRRQRSCGTPDEGRSGSVARAGILESRWDDAVDGRRKRGQPRHLDDRDGSRSQAEGIRGYVSSREAFVVLA